MVIYKTTNLINCKFYVGQDSNNNLTYLGSGEYLKRAIKKYGKENFIKEILEVCESLDELNEREKFWITNLSATTYGYNISFGGQVGWFKGLKHKPESIEKIREKSTGRKFSPEVIEKLKGKNNHFYGKNHSNETKEKISKSNKGNPSWNKELKNIYSEETLKKMSKAKLGNKYWLGKTHSDETKKKLSDINKGKKMSPEVKEKISKSNKGRVSWNKGKMLDEDIKCKISKTLQKEIYLIKNGVITHIFNSSEDAAQFFNVSFKTIGNYCRLKNIDNKFGIIYKIDYENEKKSFN